MSRQIYLDYAATTPVDPKVAEAMSACLTIEGNFANPASRSHFFGWQAEAAVETARQQVADVISADPREIVWTSGATEANNLAIKGAVEARILAAKKSDEPIVRPHVITSAAEHKAVLDAVVALENQIEGLCVTYLQPDADGVISPYALAEALRPETLLVSLMHVNNETGVIADLHALGRVCRDNNTLFHVDAAQSVGKLPIDVQALPVDMMSMCAHKVYGPKGIGALYVRRKAPEGRTPLTVLAQIHGGGHERGMRSGTLPTHQCVGMGEALALAGSLQQEEQERMGLLRDRLEEALLSMGAVSINAGKANRISGTTNVQFSGCDGEQLLMTFSGLALSSGSACTSASLDPSHVLTAMGLSAEAAHASLRFSIGRFTSDEDISQAIEIVQAGLQRIRKLG